MAALHFHKDGTLRRSFTRWNGETSTHYHSLVPLRAYEQIVDKHAFLKSLHGSIIFEDGLTVGELMENLAPWADTMIGVGVMDFPAFLEEMRKDPQDKVDDVEGIFLSYSVTLGAVPEFSRSKGDELFGTPKASGRFQVEQAWNMEARLTAKGQENYEGATSVAIDYTPMADWKHLPITIVTEGCFIDQTASAHNQVYGGVKQSLTDASHPVVNVKTTNDGRVMSHDLPIRAPEPDFFSCLLRGFMWEVGFSYSPAQRDAQMEEILESTSELDKKLSEEEQTEEIEQGMNDLESAYDKRQAAELKQKTEWLDQMEKLCIDQGLPAPIHT